MSCCFVSPFRYGSVVQLGAYYIIGLPCAYFFGFHGWDLLGIWGGLGFGVLVAAMGHLTVAYCCTWRAVELCSDDDSGDDDSRTEEEDEEEEIQFIRGGSHAIVGTRAKDYGTYDKV